MDKYFFAFTEKSNKKTCFKGYLTIRLNGPKDLAAFSTLKYAKSWFARGNLLTDNLQKSRDEGKELPTEKIALQNRKEEPKNAEGMSVGVEENVYMDGSKFL